MSSSGVDLAASKSKCLEDLLWDEKKKVLCWQKIGQESGGSENYPFSHNLPCLYFPSLFVPKSLGLKHRLCRTIPGADSLSPQLTLSPRLLFFVGFSSRSIITYQSEPYVFSPLFPSSFSFCFSRWGQKLYSTALCVHLKNHPKDLSPINTMHWGCFDFWYLSHDGIRNENKDQSNTKNWIRGSRRWKNGAHIRGGNLWSC